jgi:hypothetical protein
MHLQAPVNLFKGNDVLDSRPPRHHLSFSLFSETFSHSLSVLIYPEPSPILRLFRNASSLFVGFGFSMLGVSRGGGGLIKPVDGSVSVSLSPSGTFACSGALAFCRCPSESSLALAESSSATNQLIDHHKPPHMNDNTIKWTLYVARRRHSRRNCRQAKEALVATSSVGVGPGVKMLFQSSSKKDAMSRDEQILRVVGRPSGRK